MLRIHTSKNPDAARDYYQDELARADYYSEGNDIGGEWRGKAAEFLGLSRNVTKDQFEALVNNKNPLDGSRLTARNRDNRRAGFDFVFNSPKSVTLAFEHASMTDTRLADKILEAVQSSVRETMSEIEEHTQARVRKNKRQDFDRRDW